MTNGAPGEEGITGINVTPLVDITLVLLIIFMVTAKLIAGQGIALDLPQAVTAAATTQTTLEVSIDADGRAEANGQPVADDSTLRALARDALRADPALRTVIAASRRASHGDVMRVVDTLREAGVAKIAFAADKIDPAEARPK
jgi:biopolymer transport protein ExbD